MRLLSDYVLDHAKELHREADHYERDGYGSGSCLLRRVANEIEALMKEWQWTPIPVAEASEECGKSPTTLYRYIKSGRLPNVGSPEHPRVRRGDLNRKRAPKNTGEPSLVSKVI